MPKAGRTYPARLHCLIKNGTVRCTLDRFNSQSTPLFMPLCVLCSMSNVQRADRVFIGSNKHATHNIIMVLEANRAAGRRSKKDSHYRNITHAHSVEKAKALIEVSACPFVMYHFH